MPGGETGGVSGNGSNSAEATQNWMSVFTHLIKSSPVGVHNKQFHRISSMTIVANFAHVPPTY